MEEVQSAERRQFTPIYNNNFAQLLSAVASRDEHKLQAFANKMARKIRKMKKN